MTVDQTLQRVFPGATFEHQTLFLSDEQREGATLTCYTAYKNGRHLGTAYLDKHRVRTLPEILLVAIDPADKIIAVEVLSFSEPQEYLPRKRWYEQFSGRALTPALRLHRDIDVVTGAVRRMLALHTVLRENDPP